MRPLPLGVVVGLAFLRLPALACPKGSHFDKKLGCVADATIKEVVTVDVSADSPIIETTDAKIETNITFRPLEELPKDPRLGAKTTKTDVEDKGLPASPQDKTVVPTAVQPTASKGGAVVPNPTQDGLGGAQGAGATGGGGGRKSRRPDSSSSGDSAGGSDEGDKDAKSDKRDKPEKVDGRELALESASPLERGTRGGDAAARATAAAGTLNDLTRNALGADGARPNGGAEKRAPEGLAKNAPSPEPGPAGKGDLTAPKTAQEMTLSANAYKDVYAAAGLKPGLDENGDPALIHADGRVASASEVSSLRARLAAEPGVLASDPAFFSKISRPDYAGVKKAVADKVEADASLNAGALKDVAESADKRDVVWDKNCDKVSGQCNESAEKSYEKDKPISAEDLSRIWKRIKDNAAGDDKGALASSARGRKASGIMARLKGLVKAFSSGEPEPQAERRAIEASMIGAPGWSDTNAGRGVARNSLTSGGALAGLRASMGLGPEKKDAPKGPSRTGAVVTLGVVLLAAGLAMRLLSKRDDKPQVRSGAFFTRRDS